MTTEKEEKKLKIKIDGVKEVQDILFEECLDWFQEPIDFRPPSPKPTCTVFKTSMKEREIILNLPPKHSLWAHWLWNASKYMADYLEKNSQELVQDKRVIELGAASALPSIICCLEGASTVCSTDYPDPHLIKNIAKNALFNNCADKMNVKGYIWGQDMSFMDDPPCNLNDDATKYDLVLMADLIFNHNQHQALLKSLGDLLAPKGVCLVTFSHHNPKWIDRDMAFFLAAETFRFQCEFLGKKKYEPMFPDDIGDEEARSTVFCWAIKWKES